MKNYNLPTILLAPDSFKESLSATEVCQALVRGIHAANPKIIIKSIPLSDGGEGFLDVFHQNLVGELHAVTVKNPVGKPVQANYCEISRTSTAIIEMAQASGLTLISPSARNPFNTTSFGTGQLIAAALNQGFRRFIIGVGGSATTDGGAGMAQALGVRFFDDNNQELTEPMNGQLIGSCRRLVLDNLYPAVQESTFIVACDVQNPLLGQDGAVYTYARQKGASARDLPILEQNMESFFDMVENSVSRRVRDLPGAGAAGGMGAGLAAFLNAHLERGIDCILDEINFNASLKQADFVVTGEGQVDAQTFQGKTVMGIVNRARNHGIPVITVAGQIIVNKKRLSASGIRACYSVMAECTDKKEAFEHAAEKIEIIGRKITQEIIMRN
jgi:glycerate kinase